ncbi:beta strand repeat-containing protein [Bifidobacterium panos]|uniref:Adhesin n=1 Tax=Bifidobacterium panos TaxID=2675321 RepID=A0ABX1SX24_9BIFI|nr:adhesin [Bifidobacterium sp. DSM 109963]NMN02385.1 adhesin [Bifidobacterium sp. DSM 109963]
MTSNTHASVKQHKAAQGGGKIVATAAVISLVVGFGYGMAGCAIAGDFGLGRTQSTATTVSGGGGANTMSYDYTGSYSGVLSADGKTVSAENETTEATNSDQNTALAQNGGTLTLTGMTLNKSGDSSNADNTNFYGTNAVSLTVGEQSTTTLDDVKLNASSAGSNAIFATDSGTVLARKVTINTSADNSRGLDATYGGTIVAGELEATTEGDHCATVATDRGGGNISVAGAKLSTSGSGSPLLYSTGDVEVSDVTGTATGSQIAGMEGLNTILINKSTLESTVSGKTASDPVANGVIIYQSTSGDAEATTGEAATFQAKDSTLKSAITSGSMFYFTNTEANVVLSNTTLDFDSDAAALITAAGNDSNSWGQAGSNGATVTFTGRNQELKGNVSADTISSVTLNLFDSSTWTGAAQIADNTSASAGSASASETPISVNVDGSSTWVVTGDTTVSKLNVAQGGKVVDAQGKSVTIKNGGDTVVEGTSDITVTVAGAYGTTVETSGTGTTLATKLISREAYDSKFSTSTAWTMS